MNNLLFILCFLGIAYYIYQEPKHLEIEKYKYRIALIIVIFCMYHVTVSNELIEGFRQCSSVCPGSTKKKCEEGKGVCDWTNNKCIPTKGNNPCGKIKDAKKCNNDFRCRWLTQENKKKPDKKKPDKKKPDKKQADKKQADKKQADKKQAGGGKHPKGNNGKDAVCTAADWYKSSPNWGTEAKKWHSGKLIDGSVSDKCKKCAGGGKKSLEPCLAAFATPYNANEKCPATCSKAASWPHKDCSYVKSFSAAYNKCDDDDRKCQALQVMKLPATCSSCVIKALQDPRNAGYKWEDCFSKNKDNKDKKDKKDKEDKNKLSSTKKKIKDKVGQTVEEKKAAAEKEAEKLCDQQEGFAWLKCKAIIYYKVYYKVLIVIGIVAAAAAAAGVALFIWAKKQNKGDTVTDLPMET